MEQVPASLVDCPQCGNSEQTAGWDQRHDLLCSICGARLALADPVLAAAALEEEKAAAAAKAKASRADPILRLQRLMGGGGDAGLDPLVDEDDGPQDQPLPAPPPEPRAPRLLDEILERREREQALAADGGAEEGPAAAEAEPSWESSRAKPGVPAGRQKRRRKVWVLKPAGAEGSTRLHLPSWAFGVIAGVGCLLVAACLVWVLVSMFYSKSRSVGVEDTAGPGKGAPSAARAEAGKVADVVNRFVNARTMDERLAVVRDPDRVRPLVESFEPKVGLGKATALNPFGGGTDGRNPYDIFVATFEDNRSRLVCVVRTPSGPLVDWEAFSRQGTVTPEALLSGSATAGEMRVLAKPTNYFNYGFKDDGTWLALDLANSDWSQSLTGYVRRGGPAANLLLKTWANPNEARRLLLEVAAENDSGRHAQVVIRKILALGWVKGETAVEDATPDHPGPGDGDGP